MKANEIQKGGHYTAKVSGQIVTVRVDEIGERVDSRVDTYSGRRKYQSTTTYYVTNLWTGRQLVFRSARKLREPATESYFETGPVRRKSAKERAATIRGNLLVLEKICAMLYKASPARSSAIRESRDKMLHAFDDVLEALDKEAEKEQS